MERIGKALPAYHDEHGALPPACLRDAEGRPLHGWRTLLVAEFPVSRAVHWMAPENADEDLFARLEPAAEKSGQHMNRILTMLFADGHTESWYEDDFAAIDAAARRAFVSVSAEKPAIDS
jgi:prepilin-type processing-associated H-X9-DG protein